MSKVLALVNLELKRSKRFLVLYIFLFSALILGLNIFQMNRFESRSNVINAIVDSTGGIDYGMGIVNYNWFLANIMCISIIGILAYTVHIWLREYNGNSQSIYTLIMIPENKYMVYLSKIISIVVMIYTTLISNIVMLYVSKLIFNKKFSYLGIINTTLKDDLMYGSELMRSYIPTNFVDFVMIYGVLLLLIISAISTICVVYISFKENLVIKTSIIPMGIIGIYSILKLRIYLTKPSFLLNLLSNIGIDLTISLTLIVILHLISNKLMNEKLYV